MMVHACLMTQSELTDLEENVRLLLPYVDSVTVVDGGSVDLSIPFMRAWSRSEPKLRYFISPWKDDFPAQRNQYIRRVSEIAQDGDWILTCDPDEFFSEEALSSLRRLAEVVPKKKEHYRSVSFRCRSVTLQGRKRVYESNDDYWKPLYFAFSRSLRYSHNGEGAVHETLHGVSPTYQTGKHPEFPELFYEHRKPENITHPRGCLPTGTRIIAEHGYIPIEEIKVGDRVLAGDGTLRPVTEVMSRSVDEDIVEIRGYGRVPISLTKEHPVWAAPAIRLCPVDCRPIYKKGSEGAHANKGYTCCAEDVAYTNFGWVDAEDINKRHIMEYPLLTATGRELIPPICIRTGCNQKRPTMHEVQISPDLCRLFGYWLAEGHFDQRGKIGFSFSVYELKTLIEDVADIASRLLWRSLVIKEPKGNGISVEFSSVDLQPWMREVFGSGATKKRIPLSFIAALSNTERASLLKGIWLGDGTKSDFHYTMSVASPHLALASWVICQELHLRASLTEIPLETLNRSNSGFKHKHPMFRVTIPKADTHLFEDVVLNASGPYFKVEGRVHARPSMKEPEQSYAISAWYAGNRVQSALPVAKPAQPYRYQGVVHNIEVAEAHSYCAPYITVHNCRNLFIGGGGNNEGSKNPRWIELRSISDGLGLKTWHEFQKYLIAGSIDQRLKEWMIKYRHLTGFAGSSEHREMYKTYYRMYHPEEEPEEFRNEHIE